MLYITDGRRRKETNHQHYRVAGARRTLSAPSWVCQRRAPAFSLEADQ